MARYILQHRRGSTAQWAQLDPIIKDGEMVIEILNDGSRKVKIGDGRRKFSELPYSTSALENLVNVTNKRIDQLVALPEGSTQGDAELADIHIGYDGTEYDSAGEAVRQQIASVKGDITGVREDVAGVREDIDYLSDNLKEFIDAYAVDGLRYENNLLYLTSKGEIVSDPVLITGGGGGGGSSYSVRLKNLMSKLELTVGISDKTMISAEFYENYGDESTGGVGTLLVEYKLKSEKNEEDWKIFKTITIPQGKFSVDVASILSKTEETNVRFTVTGEESGLVTPRPLVYTIKTVEISIRDEDKFNSAKPYNGNIEFLYWCNGLNLQKTIYFEIDGNIVHSGDIGTSHESQESYTIEMVGNYDYGVHDLSVYFKTSDGATSNVLKYAILYNDGTCLEPMVSLVCEQDRITYGKTFTIKFSAFTPGQDTTDELKIRVYDVDGNIYDSIYRTNIPKDTLYTWDPLSYPPSGTAYVEVTSGEFSKTITVEIDRDDEIKYNLNPVATSLVYSYNAYGRSNSDYGKELYEYKYKTVDNVITKIKGEFNKFNWVSNGYPSGESLTISGDAQHIIKLPIFSTRYLDDDGQIVNFESETNATVTTRGRTFEIEFKVSNVTDMKAQIIKCMSDEHAGFVITPQICYLLASNGPNVKLDHTDFIENEDAIAAAYIKDNERIRISFVIEALNTIKYKLEDGKEMSGQCINIYINGRYANSFPYDAGYRFASTEHITMGSNTCILDVYDVRIYNRGLTETEILQNYKSSPRSIDEKKLRFVDNDMVDDNGDLDYYKVRTKHPCLLITGPLSPYKGALGNKYKITRGEQGQLKREYEGKYDSGITLTKPGGQDGYTVEFELLDKNEDGVWICSNNVQGTSSQQFPLKNYKIYLAKADREDDGEVKTKVDDEGKAVTKTKKVKYSLKGKDSDGRDLSIGESTLCFKSDFMSSDHANTFNANLADTLFDVKTEAQKLDPRVQNTIWGFRCLLFRRDDVDAPIEFVSDGALNNDKGNTKTFGLEVEGEEITVRAKIGKHNGVVCLSDAQIIGTKDDNATEIDFLDAMRLVKDYEEDSYTNDYYYVSGVLSYTLDMQDINKCLIYEDDDNSYTIYLLSLKDVEGEDYGLNPSCPRITDCGNLTTRQKWEFLNNTDALTTFETDIMFKKVINDKGKEVRRATLGLESCYPDEGDLKDEGLEPNYDHIQVLFTWVNQRANFWDAESKDVGISYEYDGKVYKTEYDYRKAIFIREFGWHFNLDRALIYYLFMEFTALCDNRAKNMFLRSENILVEKLFDTEGIPRSINYFVAEDTGEVDVDSIDWERSSFATWITDLYDLDSCYGVENSGYMQIPYYADWNYELNGVQKFNGLNSRLWLMFEEAFASNIMVKAQELTERKSNGLNYDALYDVHIDKNAKLVCPAIVNRDMTTKYSDPWIDGFIDYSVEGNPVIHEPRHKYMQRGSRTEQKNAFIYKRSNMLYSKYRCGKFLNNEIKFRCGVNGGLPATDSAIEITANQVIYPAIRFGDGVPYISGEKIKAGKSTSISRLSIDENGRVGYSDGIYIAGGTLLTNIGDISKFKPYDFKLQNATGLKVLNLGSKAASYSNEMLNKLDTSYCKLLEVLNVMGCTKLEELNLANNGLLKELYASNSNISSLTLPNGGVLEKLHLGSIPDLKVMNQTNLKEFSCTYDKLASLHIENTPNINTLEIVKARLSYLTGGLRLVGINETLEDTSVLDMLISDDARGKHIDINGTLLEDKTLYPYISGTVHVDTIDGNLKRDVESRYPHLTIACKNLEATLIYMNEDGTEELGREVVINGEVKDDPITNGSVSTPTKESTPQYDFTYGGWSKTPNGEPDEDALVDVKVDTAVYVAFNKTIRSYKVEFYNGAKLFETDYVEYGAYAQSPGEPNKYGTTVPELYKFLGWAGIEDTLIVGETKFYAQFEFMADKIDALSIDDFKYTPKTDDNTMSIDKYVGDETVGKVLSEYDGYEIISIDGFNDTDIKHIVLPDSIQIIQDEAFKNCTSLEVVYIPESVIDIGVSAYVGCGKVAEVNYNALQCTNCEHSDKPFEQVGPFVLTVGANVLKIPAYLFYFGKIASLIFDAGSQCETIGACAFEECDIESLMIPDSVATIGDRAFAKNTHISSLEIPNGVKSIGVRAFERWSAMTDLFVSKSVEVIKNGAFASSSLLSSITIDPDNANYYCKSNCLITKGGNKTLVAGCKNSIIPQDDGITSIDNYAFQGCTGLSEVSIPDTVTKIGMLAFYGCSSLTSVTLPVSVVTIGGLAFAECANLITINVPWSEGEVDGAPWGATNATINYNK